MVLRASIRKLGLVVAAAAVLMVPGTAAADTGVSHSGVFGSHHLDETAAAGSAARCEYGEAAGRLDFVQALRPLMKAHDYHAGSGNDLQKVAWRAKFQAFDGSTWQDVKVTNKQFATANDNAWATFPSMFRRWTADQPGYVIRVFVDMYWYSQTEPNDVVGFARHRVDFYRYHLEGSGAYSRHSGSCAEILGP